MTYPVNYLLSRGATSAREILASYLEANTPVLIEKYRTAYDLDQYTLPDPVDYRQYEPLGLDRWPLVGCVVSRVRNLYRVDTDAIAASMFRSKYEMQLFLWVRTPQLADMSSASPPYDECLRLRDDLTVIVRSVLLTDGSLGSDRMEMNEDTLNETYSEATKVTGDRWIAGTSWNFDVTFDEALVLDQIGTAETFNVTAEHHVAAMP